VCLQHTSRECEISGIGIVGTVGLTRKM
jgi:hypothetical protein